MDRPEGHPLVVALLLAGIVALGLGLRLEDPLSSPALGAEDPWTHVVFTKEHLERGYFDDARHLGTSLYPPGLHALAGIMATTTGVGLYDFARFSPAVFGVLSILGMFVLANRLGGPAAGLAAALVTAVTPEHVLRTSIFFPTMVDLALFPVFLLAADLVLERSGAWRRPMDLWTSGIVPPAILLLLVSGVFAYTHPWALPLIAAAASLFAALRILRDPGERPFLRLAPLALVVAASVALSAAARWDHGNTGFAAFLDDIAPAEALTQVSLHASGIFLALLPPLALAALVACGGVAVAARGLAAAPERARRVGAALLAVLAVVAVLALGRDPPQYVNYPIMLDPVPIWLGLVGLALALALPSRLGDVAAATALVLFPLTAVQVFDSVFDHKYWPSRVVAYLGLSAALLSAVAVAWTVDQVEAMARRRRRAAWMAPTATLAAVVVLGGAVAVSPHAPYGWYRLYPDDEFAGFQHTAGILDGDPEARVVAGSWQPALVLRGLSDPSQVRWGPKYFEDAGYRERIHDEGRWRELYVVVDRYVVERAERGEADLAFLEAYELVHTAADDGFRLYRLPGGLPP